MAADHEYSKRQSVKRDINVWCLQGHFNGCRIKNSAYLTKGFTDPATEGEHLRIILQTNMINGYLSSIMIDINRYISVKYYPFAIRAITIQLHLSISMKMIDIWIVHHGNTGITNYRVSFADHSSVAIGNKRDQCVPLISDLGLRIIAYGFA